MPDGSFHRGAFVRGAKAALPLALPPIPFALALGLLISETTEVSQVAQWSSNWIMFAGSAQLVTIQLLAEGAAPAAILLSVALINARHIAYSAAVASRLGPVPRWFRFLGSYLLIDQVFAIEQLEPRELPARQRMWLMLGAGISLFTVWMIMSTTGVLVGDLLPEDMPIGFVVALLFAGLMALAARTPPGVLAAIVGGATALALRSLPSGTGLVIAIVLGCLVGAFAERHYGAPE